MTQLAPTLEAYFTLRLIGQRQASPHTVACYRDAFKLLLAFAAQQTGRPPSRLRRVRPGRDHPGSLRRNA